MDGPGRCDTVTNPAESISQMIETLLNRHASDLLDLTYPNRPSVYREPLVRVGRVSRRTVDVMVRGEDGKARTFAVEVSEVT